MLASTLLTALPLLAGSAAALSNYGVVDMPQANRFERRVGAANSTTSLVERSSIEKRAYAGRATWYAAGLGACGSVHNEKKALKSPLLRPRLELQRCQLWQ